MTRTRWPLSVRLFILLVRLVGGGSLILFAGFLFHGSFGLVDLEFSPGRTLAWDAALCLLFFLQHSIMVRHGFRHRAERILPEHLHGVVYTFASAVFPGCAPKRVG